MSRPIGPHGPPRAEWVKLNANRLVRIPPTMLGELTWGNADQIFAVLEEPGLIRLCDWDWEEAQVVREARQEYVVRSEYEQEAVEAVLIIDDRYRRLKLNADHRFCLTVGDIHHLSIDPDNLPTHVLLELQENEVWLYSERFRELLRVRRKNANSLTQNLV